MIRGRYIIKTVATRNIKHADKVDIEGLVKLSVATVHEVQGKIGLLKSNIPQSIPAHVLREVQ